MGSQWITLPYVLYVAFGTFAMLNMMTGVFVDCALQSAKMDKENFLISLVRDLIASTGNGDMTWSNFEQQLHRPQMSDYFKAIDVDTSEAEGLFRLLDLDGSGSIDAEE